MVGAGSRRKYAPLVAVLAFALASCGGSSAVHGPSEVRAEPVSMSTTNPFTASVGQDTGGVTPPAASTSQSGRPPTYTASLPGLYGGTRNYATCDAAKLT